MGYSYNKRYMSTSFNIFLRGPSVLDDVLRFVVGELHIKFEKNFVDNTVVYRFEFSRLFVCIYGEHSYEDDLGIELSAYPYVIGITRYTGEPNPELVVEFTRALSLLLGSRANWLMKWETMVVEEMQTCVIRFPEMS